MLNSSFFSSFSEEEKENIDIDVVAADSQLNEPSDVNFEQAGGHVVARALGQNQDPSHDHRSR